MKSNKSINLEEFYKSVEESANEVKRELPNLRFDYAGIIPVNKEAFQYDCSPINAKVFAMTGGDGVHYSTLRLSEKVQPIIMTVPMNFGNSLKDYNWILGENLNEFLSLGYYNGWFPLEQLCYNNQWVIDFYSKNYEDTAYQSATQIEFVKKMRAKLGYHHNPLNNERLTELEERYFDKLMFKKEFVQKIT